MSSKAFRALAEKCEAQLRKEDRAHWRDVADVLNEFIAELQELADDYRVLADDASTAVEDAERLGITLPPEVNI